MTPSTAMQRRSLSEAQTKNFVEVTVPISIRSDGADPLCKDVTTKGKGKRSLAAIIQINFC